jgi:hypothetical protein
MILATKQGHFGLNWTENHTLLASKFKIIMKNINIIIKNMAIFLEVNMKYVIAIFFGMLSFALTLTLNNCVTNIGWLYSFYWIYIIALWNAIINFRSSLWIYYDNEQNKDNGGFPIHKDKSFHMIEQIRHFIFNFIGIIIGWVSLFALLNRLDTLPKDIGFIDLGLALFTLLGISGNLPWISTKANIGH